MCRFDKNTIDCIWSQAQVVDGYDKDKYRKDACGAWIIRSEYGNRNSPFGWEIDHIYPEAKLRSLNVPIELIDNIINLRPLNWKNNDSKGSDYPFYRACITSKDNSNIEGEYEFIINSDVQRNISDLYTDYL